MLDYRVLTFLALYDEMNYRRTAEKLNMTQPGVTQHIHYLENYYGVKLFEYDGRTLSRTKNAQRLKRYFDSIKAEEADIREKFMPTDKVSQENYVELTAASAIPNKEIKSPQILRY